MKYTSAKKPNWKTPSHGKTSAQAVHLLITKLAEKSAETPHTAITAETRHNTSAAEPGHNNTTDTIQPEKTPASHQSYISFLQTYSNKRTRQNCREALQKYLRFTIAEEPEKLNPGKTSDTAYNTLGETYLHELRTGRNYTEDLLRFTEQITKTRARKTTQRIISTIRCWLENNGFSIAGETKRLLIKTVQQSTLNRTETKLTKSLFKTIYRQMTKEWAKTLLIIMLSTGITIGEALSLKETDIIKTETGTTLRIREDTAKSKTERIAYLTKEAAESLERHLAEQKIEEQKRTEKEQRNTLKNPKRTNTSKNLTTQQKIRQEKAGCIFPYSIAAADGQMRRAVDKAGYGRVDGMPRSVHWQMIRKWFIAQVSLCADRTAAEELAGYVNPNSTPYQKIPAEKLLAAFKKAEKHLTLFSEKERAVNYSDSSLKKRL